MKKLLITVLMAGVFTAGLAYAKYYEIKKDIDNYAVDVKIDRNPPVLGLNNIEITVKDTSGSYVTDAKVKVEYSMPGMPGMPPMNYKTDAEIKDNTYRAKLNISMAGAWNISIKITRAEKTSKVKFSVNVS